MGGTGRVTSHDVANAAGVSQATVARVFSAPQKVAKPTQDKVLAAAERIGYVPNAIARSLKAQRTDIIGAVVPASGEYWQHVLTSFSRTLNDRGKQVLLFSFDGTQAVDRVLDTVAQYRLDGLILASANISTAHVVKVSQTGLRVVSFNQPAAHDLVPTVNVDNELGMGQLAELMVTRGAKSAAFVGGVASASTDQIRYRGAAAVLGNHGIACPYVEAGAFSYEAGYKAARSLAEAGLPDAVMVASDEVAFGVIDGLRELGIEAPRDVLITGFDGLPQAAWAGYDLTTLEQPTELLVQHAVELAVGADLNGTHKSGTAEPAKAPGGSNLVVPGTIREGRTTNG